MGEGEQNMIEIKAIIRRERLKALKDALAERGFYGLTHWPVSGRGKQHGVTVNGVVYDELPKEMVYIVVHDEHKTAVVTTIIAICQTQPKGTAGDGRIFITRLDEGYTISEQLL